MKHIINDILREQGFDASDIELTGVGGGSINEAFVATVGDHTYFVKTNSHPLDDQFSCEAEGLTALRDARSGLIIPEVVGFRERNGADPAVLVLEYLGRGTPTPTFDRELGEGLARLHQTSADAFGFYGDNYCGATPQPNPWTHDWAEFYAKHRIEHQLTLARARGVRGEDVRVFERLIEAIPDLLDGSDEAPALIHGDLWSGNKYVARDGRPALIDPAAYFGHREAELGMMALFGGFSRAVYEAYEAEFPLKSGWRDRQDLYKLYHVMNHFTLFGGGYWSQAVAIANRYL